MEDVKLDGCADRLWTVRDVDRLLRHALHEVVS